MNQKIKGRAILVSFIFLMLFFSLPLTVNADVIWLSGWNYRTRHVINHATGAGTNYQVSITVHYGGGAASDDDVYTDRGCRTDFGDIRFTDDDKTTELDYWMESKTDSDNAVFWVEVADDLSSEDQTIYVYWGESESSENGTTPHNPDEHWTLNIPPNVLQLVVATVVLLVIGTIIVSKKTRKRKKR